MKSFKDFKFELMNYNCNGIHGIIGIGGYEISIVMNELSESGRKID